MAVSHKFSTSIDQSIFPATLRVGHVRVYQREGEPRRCSCDPPDHPTAVWLTNHWWAVGMPAPTQVQMLVQMDVLLDGSLVVLGLLSLLAGPSRLREPLSLLVGLAVSATVAYTLLQPYYDGEQQAAAMAISNTDTTGQLEAALQAAAMLVEGTGLDTQPGASDVTPREPSGLRPSRQEEEVARRRQVLQMVEQFWLFFNVGVAALVGGLLLMMLTDLTLVVATAFACCLLLLEVEMASGRLISAYPSLVVLPLFLGVALCGGLLSFHFPGSFRTLACALLGVQLILIGGSSFVDSCEQPSKWPRRLATSVFDALSASTSRASLDSLVPPGDLADCTRLSAASALPPLLLLLLLSLLRSVPGAVLHALARVVQAARMRGGAHRDWALLCSDRVSPSSGGPWGGHSSATVLPESEHLPPPDPSAGRALSPQSPLRPKSPPRSPGIRRSSPVMDIESRPVWRPRLSVISEQSLAACVPQGLLAHLRTCAASLQAAYGFQRSSVCSQFEHLGLMLANLVTKQRTGSRDEAAHVLADAVTSLHNATFEGYLMWCKHVDTHPLSALPGAAPEHELLLDLLLYFCMWGESANLRHAPELLWWLFHALRAEMDPELAAEWDDEEMDSSEPPTVLPRHFVPVSSSADSAEAARKESRPSEVVLGVAATVAGGSTKAKEAAEAVEAEEAAEAAEADVADDAAQAARTAAAAEEQGFSFYHESVVPLYEAMVSRMRQGSGHNYDDINEAFWNPRCLSWRRRGDDAGSAAAELLVTSKTYHERRSWLHVLGAFERVYLWHWLLLRGMCVMAAGLQTCVGAEWGEACEGTNLLQLIRLLSTCVIDLQLFNVARSLVLLWREAPLLGVKVQIERATRVAANLLLSLILNTEFWLALKSGSSFHWAVSYAAVGWVLLEPGFSSLVEAVARRSVAGSSPAAGAATPPEPLALRLLRLFDPSRGFSMSAALPTRPYSSVRWGALFFWLSLLSMHGCLVYLYLGKNLVSDTLAFLYAYQGGTDLQASEGIDADQLIVLLACLWVPTVPLFLVSFSMAFTMWTLAAGGLRAAYMGVRREWNPALSLQHDFDIARDHFEAKLLHHARDAADARPGSTADASTDAHGGQAESPAQEGLAFARCWNACISQMRDTDLLSDAERARLQFGILRSTHRLARAGSRLLPPAVGSVTAALEALQRGCKPAALPRMQLDALLVVVRIGGGLTEALLGEAHAQELAGLRQLVLSQLQTAGDAAEKREGGTAWAQRTVPAALRSEALVHVCRSSLAAAAQSLLDTLRAAGELAPSRSRSTGSLGLRSGPNGMPASSSGKAMGRMRSGSGSWTDLEQLLEGGLEYFAPPRVSSRDILLPLADGSDRGVQLVAGAFGPFSRVFVDFFGGGNRSGRGSSLSNGSGVDGMVCRGEDDEGEESMDGEVTPSRLLSPSDRLGRIRHMSTNDLSALAEEPRILRGGGRGGRQEAERATANFRRASANLRPHPGSLESVISEEESVRSEGVGADEDWAALSGAGKEAESMVLSCLPVLRDALAKIVCALRDACHELALDSNAGDATRAALRSAAAALEQSMGHVRGFWRSDEYAVRCVVQLVAEEAEIELLLTRMLQLLTATPKQNHVSPACLFRRQTPLTVRTLVAGALEGS